jgi:hypothetical protein
MKKLSSLLLTSTMLTSTLLAADIDVKIVNLTKGINFTPLLVTAHKADNKLYMAGTAASENLQKMAEGGDVSGLAFDLTANGANNVENPAEGLLAPGTSITTSLTTTADNTHLSIVAMMLPTNDGFIGLNAWEIPKTAGTYMVHLNAHDAGTEANNEIVNGAGAPGELGIPADPGGANATSSEGITAEAEGYIHIHRGIVGGEKSDLDATAHRFLNPVAAVIVTVK